MACHSWGVVWFGSKDVACHMFFLGVIRARAHPFFVACHRVLKRSECVRTRFLSVACHVGVWVTSSVSGAFGFVFASVQEWPIGGSMCSSVVGALLSVRSIRWG